MSNSLMNLLVIIAAGLVLMGLFHFLPLPGFLRMILDLAVLVVLVIFVLQHFGVIAPIIPMPKLF